MRGNTVRKPILIAVAVATAIVVAIAVWYIVAVQQAGRAIIEGERSNLLLVVTQEAVDGSDIEIELISLVPGGEAAWLAVPSDLGVADPSGKIVRLRDRFADGGVDALRSALEDLLAIGIDHHVVVAGADLGRAVDGLGGLRVDVGGRVVYLDATSDPALQIDLRPGEQVLDGAMTLGFLRGASESNDDLDRQQRVARALLDAALFGCDLGETRGWARDVYEAVETDLDRREFERAVDAIADLGSAGLSFAVVPRGEQVGDAPGYVRMQVRETHRLIVEWIRGVDLLTADEICVAVFNGNGIRLMASRLSDYLAARDFQISRIANAETFGYNASYIVVLTDDAKAAILRDALPRDALVVGPEEFEPHFSALRDLVPEGTDLMLVAGAGMELD
jgi:LCP family protein required for cell wall assembly